MKPFNFKVSVKNGSKEVVAQSGNSWNGVSDRCFIRIQKDSISYSVESVEDLKLSEKFSVKNNKTIILEDDSESDYILAGDECELAFKEYEVFEVETILDSGSGYNKGDIIYLSDGEVIEDHSDFTNNKASFEIVEVGKNGQIKQIKLKNSGRYSKIPNVSNLVTTNGEGKEAELRVEFRPKSDRTIIRREIVNKIPNDGTTILFLDNNIPNNEISGVLTISKQKIVLEGEYLGVSNDSASHEIIRDFTPNFRLPFAAPNSQNLEFVFNQAMSMIDKELTKINQKLKD